MTRPLFGLLAVLPLAAAVTAQTPPAKPKFLYGHDVRVRNAGKANFEPDTPKVGIEFFHDPAGGAIVAITEAGNLAAIPYTEPKGEKKAEWAFAHELRVRKSTEDTFTKDTKKFGVEAFKDLASGKLLYVTDQKTIALADLPAKLETEKEPAWHHGLVLKVRGPNEDSFASAKKIGVEAFKDGNTGGLLYASEAGAIAAAAAPAAPPAADAVKAPRALHGLTLQARKADEGDFTEKTKAYALEVFEDRNTGWLLYVCEAGAVAAVPAPAEVKAKQKVRWSHSFVLKARKGGEKEFDKAAKYGVEVFQDNNTGYLVYLSETGSVAVVAKK